MNGLQGRRVQDIESPFPGHLGTIINLFDVGTAVGGNKLLTDKPHLDGSLLSRSRSDVARMLSPSYGEHTEDKFTVSELRRSASNKGNVTPMKKLLAREMSKEADYRQKPTNVVAKLMGLDTLPRQQSDAAAQRNKSDGYYSLCSSSHETHKCQEFNKYKDAYEIWQQSPKMNRSRAGSPKKGRYDVNMNEKRMALVRQKFMEAKRLVTDEKFHESKAFQDALEVLSSNKDLFVKFLQESNSFFSQNLGDFQPISPRPETRRITVLRPSNVVDTENFVAHEKRKSKHIKNSALVTQGTGRSKPTPKYYSSFINRGNEDFPAQPTRIVVLKPSPVNAPDIKPVASSSPSSPRVLHGGDYFDELKDVESREAREMARGITREMRENLTRHRRDETFYPSIFSNGYIGDDSSFNKSEIEYAEGNLSDSETMSPNSRHSWDCVNRFGSPYSSSSLSRASFSPESSVCREAKKRLSERWALVAFNGSFQQQKHVPKSSSTLGEMLALSDPKNSIKPEEVSNSWKLESRASTSYLSCGLNQDESSSDSPKSLLRSKSVPVSATASGTGLNVGVPISEATKAQVPRELTVFKSTKSSWKVSSLFSFRNKKDSKGKPSASQTSSETQLTTLETKPTSPAKTSDNAFPCFNGFAHEECSSPGTLQMQHIYPSEDELSIAKPVVPGNLSENQNQPSPISVLQPPFEEDDSMVADSSGLIKLQGVEMSLKSKLIDKSPPIGSIARTLSWDDSFTDTSHSAKPSSTGIEEEQDWHLFIHTLLSVAGFDGGVQFNSLLARWHSPESPLDPSLRDKYANQNNKEFIQEAKRRQHRSNRKLAFDYVNASLMEITRYGLERSLRVQSIDSNHLFFSTFADYLWTQLKNWFSSEANCVVCDGRDTNSLVAEQAVRDEIFGRAWGENMRVEVDNFGYEIETKIMEELVDEAVTVFTGND